MTTRAPSRHRFSPTPTLLALALATAATTVTPADPDADPQPFDIVIRNGRVADGTGNPAFHADVAVLDGRIAAVGRLPADVPTRTTLDASGCVVAPGFIDVHTHAENITRLPDATAFLRMGVTTLILGNCGASFTDLASGFNEITDALPAANVATLVGQGRIRGQVMGGSFLRPPTPDEIRAMQDLVRQAMEAGAVGMSTGLIYPPGTFASTEELIALASVMQPYDGIYVSHMRNEGDGIFTALEELFRIAREAGVRAEVSHIKLAGRANWHQAEKVLETIEEARRSGLDVTQDMYVYTASSTGISALIPAEAREGGRFTERIADPDERNRIADAMKERLAARGRDDYDYAVIAHYRHDPSLNGLSIRAATERLRASTALDAQIETIFEIQANGGADGVFHGMSEEDLQTFLRHPNTMIGADSSVREFDVGVPHPRGYGNAARLLGRYVRELGVLRIEEAVRKMTSLPAATFRLAHRGVLQPGAWADLVVFDPDTVSDNATFEHPHQYATGFRWVLVNGVPVVENDRPTTARPGHIVRRARPDGSTVD